MAANRMPSRPQQAMELVGTSAIARRLDALVDCIAQTDASVLITGPSGSGKEVVAHSLHRRGSRAARRFVAINCAAIPRDLLESELFGHEAGSFTGALRGKPGRFEAAGGGTLFLDEIGEMPLELQVKLLRVLETRIVNRVGGMLDIETDVRVIAATNSDLEAVVERGSFREDLFYRLNVVEIRLPALCERRDDIDVLVGHFVSQLRDGRRSIAFSEPAMAALRAMTWRGNIRELRNFVERAATLMPGQTLDAAAVAALSSTRKPMCAAPPAPPIAASLPVAPNERIDLKRLLNQVEQNLIKEALQRHSGVVAPAARMLGLNRTTLLQKMQRLNIQRQHIAANDRLHPGLLAHVNGSITHFPDAVAAVAFGA